MGLYNLIYDPVARLRPSDLLPPDQPTKPWPPLHRWRFNVGLRVLTFWGLWVGIAFLVGLVLLSSGGLNDFDIGANPSWGLADVAVMAVQLVAAIVAYVVLTVGMEQRGWPVELGWRRAGDALKGVVLGFIVISLVVGVLALIGCYRITGFNAAYSPWGDLFVLGLVAGVSEELMFRGALFRLLEDTFGSLAAIVADCLIFGLGHIGNPEGTLLGGVGIAVESLIFPALYMATRSLWWLMGLHFAWNVSQGPIWGSVVSGSGNANSWVVAEWSGPEWLTGGVFGIEASVVTMALLTVLSLWLLWHVHRDIGFVQPTWRRRQILTSGLPQPGF